MGGQKEDRKRAVLSFLQKASVESGVFLSPLELASAMREHARAAAEPSRSKTVRRVRPSEKFSLVPIAGEVCAGFGDPMDAVPLGTIPVDLGALSIPASAKTFALRVRGDSMIDAQIADGDLVIVEAREPKVGDIVAALIDGETTLKRLVCEEGRLFLRAENPRYPDRIPLHDLTVQGVMRAVVRVCDGHRVG